MRAFDPSKEAPIHGLLGHSITTGSGFSLHAAGLAGSHRAAYSHYPPGTPEEGCIHIPLAWGINWLGERFQAYDLTE